MHLFITFGYYQTSLLIPEPKEVDNNTHTTPPITLLATSQAGDTIDSVAVSGNLQNAHLQHELNSDIPEAMNHESQEENRMERICESSHRITISENIPEGLTNSTDTSEEDPDMELISDDVNLYDIPLMKEGHKTDEGNQEQILNRNDESDSDIDTMNAPQAFFQECHHDSGIELTPISTLIPPSHTASYTASHQLTPVVANTAIKDEQAASSTTTPEPVDSTTKTTEINFSKGVTIQNDTTGTSEQLRDEESQGTKRTAKVFSFTFSPDQKTTSTTSFIDLEEDSLIQQKTRKEVENKRRTEGMKTLTIITNPNDTCQADSQQDASQVNGHITDAIASELLLSKTKSRHLVKNDVQNEIPSSYPMKSPEVPARSSWKKLVTQNLSSSNGERRKSLEKLAESSPKQKIHQVKLEVIDDEQKKISSRKRDEEKRRSSLLEWEALQRQRLEDEEKNRINKNLSMKPVSAKIKELVKMHGSFMSMFSKDKKTDINGTVDGKDDIVFRKMSSDIAPFDVNSEPLKESPLPMKSPYIVKKLLTPSKHHMPEDAKSHKINHKDLPKPQSSGQRTPRTSRRTSSKTRTMRDRSESPAKIQTARKRSPSPAKFRSARERSPSPSNIRSTRGRSPSPAKIRTTRGRSPSPARVRITKERSPSPAKLHTRERSPSPLKSRITRERSASPSKLQALMDRSSSPSKLQALRERSQSPFKPQLPDRLQSSAERSFTREKLEVSEETIRPPLRKDRVSRRISTDNKESSIASSEKLSSSVLMQRPSGSPSRIKKTGEQSQFSTNITLHNSGDRGEEKCVVTNTESRIHFCSTTKDQTSTPETNQRISPPIPPKPRNIKEKLLNYPSPQKSIYKEESEHKDNEEDSLEYSSDVFNHEMRNSMGRSSIKDPKNRKDWLNKMLNTISSDHLALLHNMESTTQPGEVESNHMNQECKHTSENSRETAMKTITPPVLPPKKSSNTTTSSEALHSHLSATVVNVSPVAISKYTPSPKLSVHLKSSSSLLSKSGVIANTSYFSKSELSPPSTPTSLRSSVREALLSEYPQTCSSKRGPVSLSSILGDSSSRSSSLASTPLTSPRATPERVIRKDSVDLTSKLDVIPESNMRDSIQVPQSVEEQKENIAPFSAIRSKKEDGETPGSSSSYRYRSPVRLKTQCLDKKNELKDEGKESNSEQGNSSDWKSQLKPFTFGKPSVTMKTMASGVDFQRVSTSRNSNSGSVNTPTNIYEPKPISNHKETYLSNSYPRDNKDPIAARFSKERISLKAKINPEIVDNDSLKYSYPKTGNNRTPSTKKFEPLVSNFSKEKSPTRTRAFSNRSTPDREEGPVSLATILSKNESSNNSISEEQSSFQFKPNLSFSKEMNDITYKYRKDIAIRRYSSDAETEDTRSAQSPIPAIYDSDDVFDRNSVSTKGEPSRESSMEPKSKESSPVREIRGGNTNRSAKEKSTGKKQPKDVVPCSSGPPKGLPKTSSSGKERNRVVRRNSSLKRNRPNDSKSHLTPKKERKNSEDDPADTKSETIVQNDAGWTKTKTTVRRARLGSSEKTKQIVRTNSGKTRKEKTFKADASKALEAWAAGTNVDGKLMKKEGQRFSHETEEEVKGGQRSTRSVARRVVRRGSRRLSGGGELLTETKETSSKGAPKEGQPDEERNHRTEVLAIDDGLSRKMKTSTDGERYMTQSVSKRDGKQTYTTEGVNNKTTNSVELIGGDDFEAKREVLGKTGHRVLVERSKDNLGRPSTVVRKVTSQSRVVITKTKRKTPVVV